MIPVVKKWNELSMKSTPVYTLAGIPVPSGVVGIITAAGGKGKTMIAIWMAYDFLLLNPHKKALLWLTEDTENELRKRLVAIRAWRKDCGTEYVVEPDIACDAPVKFTKRTGSGAVLSDDFLEIRTWLMGYDFVVLDPLLSFNGGHENDNGDARVFMSPLVEMAKAENKVVIILHHNSKGIDGDSGVRGASDFTNAARYVYEVKTGSAAGMRSIALKKDNMSLTQRWAPIGEYLDHPMVPWSFWPDDRYDGYEESNQNVTFSFSSSDPAGYEPKSTRFDRVADLVRSKFNYSASQFADKYRNGDNAQQGQTLMILDYDDGMTLDEARVRFATHRAIIATTRNHQKEKHGVTCDRFRVIMQCKSPILLQKDDYREMMRVVVESFKSDPACINNDRFYYGNPSADVEFTNGLEMFDWEHYWKKAQAKRRIEQIEYEQYRREYNVNGTADSKKRGRDTFAEKNLKEGSRNVTLYKIAKFAERDGVACEDIVAEIYDRGSAVGLTDAELKLITREYRP